MSEIEFVDGPAQGRYPSSTSQRELPQTYEVPLAKDGTVFRIDREDEPAAVAIYRQHDTGGYRLQCISSTEADLAKHVQSVNERRARDAAAAFYANPNYSIYNRPPDTDHRQVFIQHGQRQAYIDEGLSGVVRELWRLGMDTIGSCQEARPGEAYIGFCLRQDAATFHSTLCRAGFESTLKEKEIRIGRPEGKSAPLVVPAGNVVFPTASIGAISDKLQSIAASDLVE